MALLFRKGSTIIALYSKQKRVRDRDRDRDRNRERKGET